ncbi:MAG: hypothetical protein ABL931_08190 [Usitatibacteraceae bacterium]
MMMIIGAALIGTLCVLAHRIAVYALPVMLGFEIARFAYGTGAGMIGAGLVGFIAGAVAFGLLSVVFVSLKSPIARIIIGLIFALPAAGAGYALVSGVSASAVPSDLWRPIFTIQIDRALQMTGALGRYRFPVPSANRSLLPVSALADPTRPRRGMSDRRPAFGLVRLPATADARFFPPPSALQRETKKRASAALHSRSSPPGAGPGVLRSHDCHRGRDGRGPIRKGT